jgi:hypothetical protein
MSKMMESIRRSLSHKPSPDKLPHLTRENVQRHNTSNDTGEMAPSTTNRILLWRGRQGTVRLGVNCTIEEVPFETDSLYEDRGFMNGTKVKSKGDRSMLIQMFRWSEAAEPMRSFLHTLLREALGKGER